MNEIKNFFSERAAQWDKVHRHCDFKTALKVAMIAKEAEGKKVLDAGCGTGIMIPFLLACFSEVSACDISDEMVKIARKKYPLAKIFCLDFEKSFFFKPDYFDVVIIYNAFPHFKDPLKTFRKANRTLKKGGLLIIAHSLNRKELGLTHKRAGGIVGNHTLLSNTELRKNLNLAGFNKISIKEEKDFVLKAVKK